MNYRILGRTGWQISEISLGSFGTFDVPRNDSLGRENVLAVIRAAVEQGVNLIDTANMYGNSEEAIGEALTVLKEEGTVEYGIPYKDCQDPQKKIYIATKTWASSINEAERQITNSFKVLQTDFIDLFQIHNLSIWKELIPILKEVFAQKRIGAIGVTHYAESSFVEMLESIYTGEIDTVQVPYNISQTQAARIIFPETQHLNLGVLILIMTPITPLFQKGFLLKKVQRIDLSRFLKYGCQTAGQILLKFVISHPAVTCAIPATSKAWRIVENTAISNGITMSESDQNFLMNLAKEKYLVEDY